MTTFAAPCPREVHWPTYYEAADVHCFTYTRVHVARKTLGLMANGRIDT